MNTDYDTVIYPSVCQAQTHPDRLAVSASLFGLDPAPPESCRVLEIGCGDGSNLLPLAVRFPQSRFVGFDLAQTRIEAGRENITNLGLSNLELIHANILDFPMHGESFDYIIAHGIYSWVAMQARDRLLAICRSRLAPHGVAFISYNCLPGCHIRRLTREIMRFHTRAIEDPGERVRQAVAVCQLIAHSIEKPDTYRQLFKEQLDQTQRLRSGHMFHDDLADINDPVYFHEFAGHAARHQLQFLAEADFFEMQDNAFTPEAHQILAQMDDSRLTREQYLDFIKCRRFRQTLLVHSGALIQYPAIAAPIARFHISSRAQGTISRTGPIECFTEPRGGALEIGSPLGIRALHILAEHWPATVSFPDLLAAATELPPDLTVDHAARIKAQAELCVILLEAYRAGIVDFRRTPIQCATMPSARPAISRFARWQLARSATVTTLRGDNLRIEDEIGKRLLLLLDGSRTLEELNQSLHETVAQHDGNGAQPNGQLAGRLQELAAFALLES